MKKFFSFALAAIEYGLPPTLCAAGLIQAVLGDLHAALLFTIMAAVIVLCEQVRQAAKDARAIRILIVAIAVQVGAARKVEARDE
jgi:hypothetical protein